MISRLELERYKTEGYAVLESALSAADLRTLRERCDEVAKAYEADVRARKAQVEGLTHLDKRYYISLRYRSVPGLWRFLFGDFMAQLVREFVGPEAYLFFEGWGIKPARRGTELPWHQDDAYLSRLDPSTRRPAYTTFWCALDDVDEKNGTLYVMPHSRAGTGGRALPHRPQPWTDDLVADAGGDRGEAMILPAGSIVVFDSRVLHRSGPNRSSAPRRAYFPQYSPAPFLLPDGRPVGLVTPFLRAGRNVYDPASDVAEAFGPVPWTTRSARALP